MSEEALRQIALQVRNWGKWGPDDELGTLNYITPERIAAACRLATTGKVFALGIPLDRNGPQSGTRQRFNPIHTMFRDGGDAPKTPDEVRAMEGYGGSDDSCFWRSWPPTARPKAATPSCSSRRRSPWPARSAPRSTRTR